MFLNEFQIQNFHEQLNLAAAGLSEQRDGSLQKFNSKVQGSNFDSEVKLGNFKGINSVSNI